MDEMNHLEDSELEDSELEPFGDNEEFDGKKPEQYFADLLCMIKMEVDELSESKSPEELLRLVEDRIGELNFRQVLRLAAEGVLAATKPKGKK